ncbi:MAG: glucose 1-dehydrogenase [Methyloligellaceae bacterium]
MSKLNGKVALVTGGNSGIGLGAAQELINEGATVYITGRRQEELDKAVAQIGGDIHAIRGDVTSMADLDGIYETIKGKSGKLDILFANAGIAEMLPLEAVTEDHYDRQFNINVKGVFFTVQKALPLLSDGASVMLTASVASTKGMENFSVYSATKAAVRSFARTWAADLKARKIRVNAISPGPVETPIFKDAGFTEEQQTEMGAYLTSIVPLARYAQPSEVGKVVVFLGSDDASYINGVELAVDGGLAQI